MDGDRTTQLVRRIVRSFVARCLPALTLASPQRLDTSGPRDAGTYARHQESGFPSFFHLSSANLSACSTMTTTRPRTATSKIRSTTLLPSCNSIYPRRPKTRPPNRTSSARHPTTPTSHTLCTRQHPLPTLIALHHPPSALVPLYRPPPPPRSPRPAPRCLRISHARGSRARGGTTRTMQTHQCVRWTERLWPVLTALRMIARPRFGP